MADPIQPDAPRPGPPEREHVQRITLEFDDRTYAELHKIKKQLRDLNAKQDEILAMLAQSTLDQAKVDQIFAAVSKGKDKLDTALTDSPAT